MGRVRMCGECVAKTELVAKEETINDLQEQVARGGGVGCVGSVWVKRGDDLAAKASAQPFIPPHSYHPSPPPFHLSGPRLHGLH